MNDYVSSAPEFSLKEGTYDEVQQVTLTSATGGTIYYTTDGSDPTESSTEYKEAVLLQSEGDTEIRAIAVNNDYGTGWIYGILHDGRFNSNRIL